MRIVDPTGKLGEDLAAQYLTTHKYKILDRNFRRFNAEIDIIAIDMSEKEQVLAFIEVKTRRNESYGSPFESITQWKLRNLTKTAELYKIMYKHLPEAMRIDAVSVMLKNDGSSAIIDLIKNIGY